MSIHIKNINTFMDTFIESRDMLADDMELHKAEYGEVKGDAPIKVLVNKMDIIIKESHEEENR